VLSLYHFFLFFFFFLESYDYCFKIQNPAYSSRYGIKKPPIPLGKSQPSKSLWGGTNRTSRPQQETLVSVRRWTKGIKSKNTQEESGKPMAHSSGQKEKRKIKQSRNHLKSSCANSMRVARLGIIEVLGSPNGPAILATHSKKRKEIVQYYPPRGRL